MRNLKNKLENETKTRINILCSVNSDLYKLHELFIKRGIFKNTDFLNDNYYSIFPTEILYSLTRNNIINVYVHLKKYGKVLKELKDNVFKALYETSMVFENMDDNEVFKQRFSYAVNKLCKMSLSKFLEVEDAGIIFNGIKFQELLNEIKKLNSTDEEIYENIEELIWKQYFNSFETNLKKKYGKWIKRMSKYYADSEEGYEYINEEQECLNSYSNKDFNSLCKIIYGNEYNCGLIINRTYMEIPSNIKQLTGVTYIDCILNNQDKNIAKIIESRISEDYKELFLLIIKGNEDMEYFSKLKESVSRITLDKRIFCIFEILNYDIDELLKKIGFDSNYEGDLIDILKNNISKIIGISKDKIIITKEFMDLDKNNLSKLHTNIDFTELLKMVKKESEFISKTIKIKSKSKNKIINISLNQERMSVQALMLMLYERYNDYLVGLWNKIAESEKNSLINKKYPFSEINTIIRTRKDNYRDYKHNLSITDKLNYDKVIDFSIKSDNKNDSKKILKMLLNYGYNTVGFDSNENKIIVNVNGEISKEDKENLIRSIKGRLEESAISYFENAFLMNISKNKFKTNNIRKALEVEKNITIDDFYSAFKEAFIKMSDNILRYEVYLQ